MKNVIIGTAGHVDHGKTCLIKALTGIDTDRLKEEKKRGITIELGFADLPNDMDMDIGIIDVPGHEKFVRHMLAGIGGIDMVLLIIAADEGIMPQTAEHFEILKMLHIPRGIVVITKTDMVDEDWLEMVREDIVEYVKGTFLEAAPVMEVSSYTGRNIEALKDLILDMAKDCGSRREKKELLRLPADRVFTVDGFGTVITGTLMEGSVEKGDEVMVYPAGKQAKVRNIQVHGQDVDRAAAGQRTAINLSGIKKEEIRRGDVVAWPDSMENSMILDVKIDMFKDTGRLLKSGSRLHFYYGSAECLCKAVLIADDVLKKGQSGYGQLRFEEEIAVKRGDRFVLRFYSPMETIGGGRVLNAVPPKRRRFDDKAVKSMEIQDKGSDARVLEQMLLEESHRLTDAKTVVKKMGKTWDEALPLFDELTAEGVILRISDDLIMHRDAVEYMEKKALEILKKFHDENPVNSGMQKEEFRNRLRSTIIGDDMKKTESVIDVFLKKGSIRETAGLISAAGFSVQYTKEQQELAEAIEEIYRKAGFEPPEQEEVTELYKNGRLARQMTESLYHSGKLQKISYRYYMHMDSYRQAVDILTEALRQNGKITLAEYRDMIGTSRKYAMLILDHTDAKKITKMINDYRILIE